MGDTDRKSDDRDPKSDRDRNEDPDLDLDRDRDPDRDPDPDLDPDPDNDRRRRIASVARWLPMVHKKRSAQGPRTQPKSPNERV